MYETASKKARVKDDTPRVIADLLAEFRAGLIPETPEGNKRIRPNATNRAATQTQRPAPIQTTAAKSTAAKPTTTRASKTDKAAAESKRKAAETARKCAADISALKAQQGQLTKGIIKLSADKAGNADAICDLKNKRDELQKKIDKLEEARTACRRML